MEKSDIRYGACVAALRSHLKPAMGCTEPIAIAYAAAVAHRALGRMPERARVEVSGNILKNAMAVTVPHTNGRKGIDAACAAGIVAGDPDRELEVLAGVTDDQLGALDAFLARRCVTVDLKPDARLFDIVVSLEAEGHRASARIADRHTNVVEVDADGVRSVSVPLGAEAAGEQGEQALTIEGIFDFAETCDLKDVEPLLRRQIDCNMAIAEEGLSGRWGAAVGRVILDAYGDRDVRVRAKAWAAAGSDARMSGCEMPVVINAGSGNQGITVSVPVVIYARALGVGEERMLRALVLSNLVAIHEKSSIGCLSAYCGAISAGCAAGAGIAWLQGGDLWMVSHTIVNSLAVLSGTICDGAKPSCAAKIASAVDAAITGYEMAVRGKQFVDGEGIVKKGIENTINSVGRLAQDGMRDTDREILEIMIQ
ncbi:MAG: serine dehydratase subunit alpha family protein [Clostridia bacterium]|nr:serine dehydratase subunit alpha family protein [Clostridia bacterium]